MNNYTNNYGFVDYKDSKDVQNQTSGQYTCDDDYGFDEKD